MTNEKRDMFSLPPLPLRVNEEGNLSQAVFKPVFDLQDHAWQQRLQFELRSSRIVPLKAGLRPP